MAGRFSKQAAPYLSQGPYLNSNNSADTVIGGSLSSSVYAQIGASQTDQNIPGDRFIFTPSDVVALSNLTSFIGQLYTGTYRYVAARNNSTSIPQPGRAGFWARAGNNTSNDALYEVTSDEAANIGVALFAGVYINWIPLGASGDEYWFIQESGKTTCQFTGNNGNNAFGANMAAPAIGAGVYLAAASSSNANNTVGLFTQLVGGNSAAIFAANSTTAYGAIDNMIVRYVGPAETLPSNGNFSLVDITLSRASFRW